MKHGFLCVLSTVAMLPALAAGQQTAHPQNLEVAAATNIPRTADRHPDLSGIWTFAIDLPPVALKKKEADGKVVINHVDASAARPANVSIAGALPFAPAPSYKPEFQAKVKYLSDNESKTDQTFYCGRPGVPRIGPPRKIVQLSNEMIFLYEDISGNTYRIIPTDGRAHRADANPTYYGDSVAHWEGDKLVVDVTNFVEDTWFGEDGYFHTAAMHVTEHLWRQGDNLVYQATVEDPNVLTAPWTMAPHLVKPSTDPIEEAPACVETDANLLLNSDHHRQR